MEVRLFDNRVISSAALRRTTIMLPIVAVVAGLIMPSSPVHRPASLMLNPVQPVMMSTPSYAKMLNLLNQWDDDEDGDATSCMTGMELEFLAERVGTCDGESCEALLPELSELFDAVLADCDEACVSIKKMRAKLGELAA